MDMQLYFYGLGSLYEAEHTARLFFPGAHIVQERPPRGQDAVMVRLSGRRLLCGVRCQGACRVHRQVLYLPQAGAPDSPGAPEKNVCVQTADEKLSAQAGGEAPFSAETEYLVCRALFLLLCRATGSRPPWGMLTGVRPVRLVRRLRAAGRAPEEVEAVLRGRYFVSEEKYRLAARTADNEAAVLALNTPRSYSLYISIPFCPSRCSYCSFVSRTTAESGRLIAPYMARLCEELADIRALARRMNLRLETVYIGGGTPTAIPPEALRLLLDTVRTEFDIGAVREYTVEAGRPDCTTPEKLSIIQDAGATRISINPQTLSDSVLRAIGRRHTAQDILDCFAEARRLGFQNINMDLIAGLPGDTAEGFAASLRGVLALRPENVTVHTLTLKRASNLVTDGAQAAYGDAARMLAACGCLEEAGYEPYYLYRQKGTLQNLENTGYTKPGFAGLYNVFIMEEIHTILSAGAGGSTKMVGTDGAIRRIFNYKYPSEYIEHFDEVRARKKGVEEFYAEHVDLDSQAAGGNAADEFGGAHAKRAGGHV